jgi:hypothetical protein
MGLLVAGILGVWALAVQAASAADTEVQVARQRYRFEFLAAQPALTGLEGSCAQVLYLGARVTNRGAEPALKHITVLVNVRFKDRRAHQVRAQVKLEGIESRGKGIVFFPVPLSEEFDPRRLPELDRITIQVETNPSAREKTEDFVEFGAPASPGLGLASVDTKEPDAPVVYLDGQEALVGGRRGRLIRPQVPFWSGPGAAAAAVDGEGSHGQPVRQIASKGDWAQIRTFPGKTGWVPEMLLSKTAPETEEPPVVKVRNYGAFRFVDYSVLPSQRGGTVVEGRMLNDTGSFYHLATFEVLLEDKSGRWIASGQAALRDFGRKEIAPFVVVFDDIPSYVVARAKFRLKDTEKKTEVIIIEGTDAGGR